MPTAVSLPSCQMDAYKALYPELDFSRVGFYSGLPSVISLAGPDGFTMASGAASPDIRVYIKDYEPCGQDTFLNIAHELVHVIQIQGMLGGGHIPGSWTAYYTSQTLNCTRGWSTCSNRLEKEAYDFANGLPSANCGAEGKVRDFVYGIGVPPCNCTRAPWPVANPVGGQSYAGAIKAAGLVKTGSDVGRTWCSLITWPASLIAGAFSIFGFSNLGGAIGSGAGVVIGGIIGGYFGFVLGAILGGPIGAAIGAFLGALLGSIIGGLIGGAIGWAISEIGDWIGGLFSGPSARIWFTAFDGADWVIPDVPVSQNGHSLTSEGPAMAFFNSKLFLAYKGKDSDDLWFNTFDGHSWLATDVEITQNGHSKTDARPALAAFNGKLFLAYKGSGSNDLWFNTFDGANWLANDLKITQNGHSKTDAGPALAVFNGKLFLAYKGAGSNDLWFNTFDGANWLANDLKITQNGHTKTDAGPALAVFNGKLFLVYKGAGSDDLWFNTFDGSSGWRPISRSPRTDIPRPTPARRSPSTTASFSSPTRAPAATTSGSTPSTARTGSRRTSKSPATATSRPGEGPPSQPSPRSCFMAYRDNS